GSIAFSGQGYESFGGWEDIRDKLVVSKSTDWSSYSFGKTTMLKEAFDGFSKGISIGEDKNIQSWFRPKKANEEKSMDSLFKEKFISRGYGHIVYPKIDSSKVNVSPSSERGLRINSNNRTVRFLYEMYLKDSAEY